MYAKLRDRMKTGDLLQWSSNGLLGWAIRTKTGGDFSHTSGIIRMKEYEGLDRRVFTAESVEGSGVVLKLLSRAIEQYDGSVWWYPLNPEFNGLREAVGTVALERLGIPYDYGSLFKQLLAKVSVGIDRLFCSEYWYYIYGAAGVLQTGWDKKKAPNPSEMLGLGVFLDGEQLK